MLRAKASPRIAHTATFFLVVLLALQCGKTLLCGDGGGKRLSLNHKKCIIIAVVCNTVSHRLVSCRSQFRHKHSFQICFMGGLADVTLRWSGMIGGMPVRYHVGNMCAMSSMDRPLSVVCCPMTSGRVWQPCSYPCSNG